jgi:hypothetical protein
MVYQILFWAEISSSIKMSLLLSLCALRIS